MLARLLTGPRAWSSPAAARSLFYTPPCAKTFEPDYLDSAVPPVPTYPPINIQIKGYNYDVLEAFQSYVHNLAENMGVDVQGAWITPPKTQRINLFVEGGTRIKNEFTLNTYERNVQVSNLRSVDAPILIDTVRAALPEGVHLSFHEHMQEHFEERYIPDPFINSLRSELAASSEKQDAIKAEKLAASAAKAKKKQTLLLQSLESGED